jgi:hypothetical protein
MEQVRLSYSTLLIIYSTATTILLYHYTTIPLYHYTTTLLLLYYSTADAPESSDGRVEPVRPQISSSPVTPTRIRIALPRPYHSPRITSHPHHPPPKARSATADAAAEIAAGVAAARAAHRAGLEPWAYYWLMVG